MVEGGNRSVVGGFFASKSKTAVGKLKKWTCKQVAQAAVSGSFSFNAVFVCGEDQVYMCEVWQVGGAEVEGMDAACMDMKQMLERQKGVLVPSALAAQYSPGLRRKKKAMKRRLNCHCHLPLVQSRWFQRKTSSEICTGLTHAGGGLPLL
eukprot:6779600-Ditylum_brightwellii.AAC.1